MTAAHPTLDDLAPLLDGRSDADVLAALSQPGAIDAVLDEVFARIVDGFRPDRAGDGGGEAVVHYVVAAPDGERRYSVVVADGTCLAERGEVGEARFTLRAKLVDFLRLMNGRLPGMKAFMTGKLKVSGDLFFAQSYDRWFDTPGNR